MKRTGTASNAQANRHGVDSSITFKTNIATLNMQNLVIGPGSLIG
jgi:hypothetical protein